MRRLLGCALAAAVLTSSTTSCISFQWGRGRVYTRPAVERMHELVPGESDLADCLERLGAPNEVWEADGERVALVWWWIDAKTWGLSISVPVLDQASVSAAYQDTRAPGRGVVALFDSNLVLESWRRGSRALVTGVRRTRPGYDPALEESP